MAGAVSLSRQQGMDLCALGRRWPCTAAHTPNRALGADWALPGGGAAVAQGVLQRMLKGSFQRPTLNSFYSFRVLVLHVQ